MIKKTFFVALIFGMLSNFLIASVDYINYNATFGVLGTVATLKNKIIKKTKTYEIESKVELKGLAKVLMNGHTERHISKGHMENGMMVSDLYQSIQKSKDKTVSKEYRINHKKKYVTKRMRKWKNGKLIKDKKQKLKFYAKDDLLTLYFNLGKAVPEKGKTYHFKAVGLEKQKGKVKITVPNKAKLAPYIKDLGKGATLYAKALIHQRNFKKKKGDILLSLAKDGYIEKSVIKDVILYGDVRIERLR